MYKMFNFKLNSNKKGFTLIELLVVVAIIGVLASVVLVSLADARAKGRDSKRISDMKALQTAIEMAKTDGINPPASYAHSGTTVFNYLRPTYLQSIPIETYPATANSADLYYFCNLNTFVAGNLCHNDTDISTYAIRFRTEKTSKLGPAGYYCSTSTGIFPRELGNNPGSPPSVYCTQR